VATLVALVLPVVVVLDPHQSHAAPPELTTPTTGPTPHRRAGLLWSDIHDGPTG
jgi:hypothetical protein